MHSLASGLGVSSPTQVIGQQQQDCGMAPSDEVKEKDATKVHLAALKRGEAPPCLKRL